MSSNYVRTQIKSFITVNIPTEDLVDLTGSFQNLGDVLANAGITYQDPWLGIQFIGSEELPINVGANNDAGCYREYGSVFLHIVAMASLGCHNGIITRSETIRNELRGQRIGDIIVENLTPPNFELGATLDFEGGWVSASVVLNYYRDLNL